MLEYFTYKKVKKHKAAKKAREEEEAAAAAAVTANKEPNDVPEIFPQTTTATERRGTNISTVSDDERPPLPQRPVLDRSDESFIQKLLAENPGPDPAVPDQVTVPELDWPTDDTSSIKSTEDKKAKKEDKKGKGKQKEKEAPKGNRLSMLFTKSKKRNDTLKPEDAAVASEATAPGEGTIPDDEVEREKKDLNRVLDRLNLSAKNNKVISLSDESADLLQKFTQVFKDLANGVPTAYDDLVKLVTDRDGAINRGFEKLPSSLQKLVTQLPDKLTSSIAPEILAAAAASQGLKVEAGADMKGTAKKMFMPNNLLELITKPGALVSMLRAIVSALQTRWPAFIGVNVIWSVALFLLMFVLWYCHKRGREVRLEQEKTDAEAPVDGSDRIEELPDDPALPAPQAGTARIIVTDGDNEPATVPRGLADQEMASSSTRR